MVCRVEADTTGAVDATEAFEEALGCSVENGFAQVLVPRGTYAISKTLTIPEFVSVVGEPQGALALDDGDTFDDFGTLPVLRFPGGFASDALVMLQRSSVSGLHIDFETEQASDKAAIRVASLGLNIKKVRITRAGIGVYSPPDVNSGRIYVRQVEIAESRIGLWIDYGLDVSRFQDIRVTRASVAPNTWGVIFGKNDYMLASQIAVSNVATGLEFRDTASPTPNVKGSIATLTGYQSKGCTLGFLVKGAAQVSSAGLVIDATNTALRAGGSAMLAVSGATLSSKGASAVLLGDDASLTITGSSIDRSDPSSGEHGIAVSGGRFLNVTGTTFKSNGYGVYFSKSPVRGTVAGNTFELTNPSGRAVAGSYATVTVGGNGANR
ncbi:MAG: right-handed parallel beta-helix repeat-containing protein [Myxococcales bacterium]|nr:right-handed parallel beta-helix repeat-containing protein [Myxococcales bacterium]